MPVILSISVDEIKGLVSASGDIKPCLILALVYPMKH